MKIKLIGFLSASALALAAATPALAGQINFSSQGLTPNTALDTPTLISGVNVFASTPTNGWGPSGCSNPSTYTGSDPCLYYKYTAGSPSETGLGLTGDPAGNHEIYYPNGIAFLPESGSISSIELGSVQAGESWQILGCNGTCYNVLDAGIGGNGNDTVTINGLGNYSVYIVTVPCADGVGTCNPWAIGGTGGSYTTDIPNNILVMSITTVPEPGTLALLAAGLAALGFAVSRRRKAGSHA